MDGVTTAGFITALWAATALIFQEWVLRFDLVLAERLTGMHRTDTEVAQQRRLLEQASRALLGIGLLVFCGGIVAAALGLS